jgi:hypothetical protein
MAGRKPRSTDQEHAVLAALQNFAPREQALFVMGLNTGFRITELFSLDVGQVWEAGKVRPRVTVEVTAEN